ncbi:MAG: T9SS type A sorting domain-containing protein [Bacteroidetes bacterium]|nr:T9SS type A sorting domain-containing protein [Bacteroidota bacterium]
MKPITVFLLSLMLAFSASVIAQNNSLAFDGTNDYVSVPDNSTLDLSSAMTLEFWVYLSGTDGKVVLSKSNSDADENFRIYIDQSANQIYFDYGNENQYAQTIEFTLDLYTWYHMAFTVSAGNPGKIYVNGVEATTYTAVANAPTPIPTNTHAMEIGGCTAYASYFAGKLDEIRIWNDIRTEDEIRQNMYRELPDPAGESNLVAYYKLNSTSGTNATDSKGSNTGTLTNMTGSEWQTSPAMFGPKNALDFDGADYVSINSVLGLGKTNVTIESWVYLPDANRYGTIARLGKHDYGFGIGVGNGSFDVSGNELIVLIDAVRWIGTNVNIGTGWHHVAFSIGASNDVNIYLDGKNVYTEASFGTSARTPIAPSYIGAADQNNRKFSGGKIDEVRYWSKVRTATEIRENMCKNLTGNEDYLAAYYSFDNTSGAILQDFTGNEYDGTLHNMDNPDWVPSSAFNTWLNTSSSSWSTITNWSLGSKPLATDNVGIFSYTGGSAPAFTSGDEAGAENMVVDITDDWSIGGYLGIAGNLIAESNIDLNGQTIALGTSATLIEDAGRIYGSSGNITTTRSLSNISAENVAGLGAQITTSANMGSTTITRTHSANSSPASIARRFDISPFNNSGLNATLVFHYDDSELNGLAESYLELSKSTDGGTSWVNQNGSINTFVNTIVLTGINAFSSWTAMESEDVTPPVLETQNPSQSYISGTTAISIAPNTTVTTSSPLVNATVSISPIVEGDILSVSNLPEGLSSNWVSTTKILTISGTGSASDYQIALRNVTFESTASSDGTRTIDFILGDGVGLVIEGEQHFYEVVYESGEITWTNARAAALASRFGLAQGYLATITSQSENEYLFGKISQDTWIGANDAGNEGVWKWIDGPETGVQFWQGSSSGSSVGGRYNNWASGEPNNAFGTENYAHMYCREDFPGKWNDYNDSWGVKYYIVEYGGDGSTFTTIDDATINVEGNNTWVGNAGSDWNTGSNWSAGSVPLISEDIIIPNVATKPIINSGIGASCNNLTINVGASLTINSGGSLITNGSITNNGTISVSRTLSEGAWHLVSMPVTSGTASLFEGDYLQYWTESTGVWTDITETTYNLTPGQGYSLWGVAKGDHTYTFAGTPNRGNVSRAITHTEVAGTGFDGANLLGNPYPSSIDWSGLDDTYGAVNYWNGTAYVSWNDGSGSGSQYIPPMQGFFIVTGTAGTFSVGNANRTHTGATNYYKSLTDLSAGLVLFADNGSYRDDLWLLQRENRHAGFDLESDAYKFMSSTPGISQLWSVCPDGNLSIDARPYQEIIQLGFANDQSGIYTIGVSEIADIATAILEDTKANLFHDLTKGAYEFAWQSTDNESRFILHLGVTGLVELNGLENLLMYASGQILYLKPLEGSAEGTLWVYDLAGRILLQKDVNLSGLTAVQTPLARGVYVVSFSSKGSSVVKKVIIQ